MFSLFSAIRKILIYYSSYRIDQLSINAIYDSCFRQFWDSGIPFSGTRQAFQQWPIGSFFLFLKKNAKNWKATKKSEKKVKNRYFKPGKTGWTLQITQFAVDACFIHSYYFIMPTTKDSASFNAVPGCFWFRYSTKTIRSNGIAWMIQDAGFCF